MAFYQQSDLLYTYQWETRDDDPKLRGEPDHSLFNRHQGAFIFKLPSTKMKPLYINFLIRIGKVGIVHLSNFY